MLTSSATFAMMGGDSLAARSAGIRLLGHKGDCAGGTRLLRKKHTYGYKYQSFFCLLWSTPWYFWSKCIASDNSVTIKQLVTVLLT
jgi:hypothetical protein